MSTCGDLMKDYTTTKATGYAVTSLSIFTLRLGINDKNGLLISTGSIGSAIGIFLIMGSENKFIEIGNKLKKVSFHLSPTKLKIKF